MKTQTKKKKKLTIQKKSKANPQKEEAESELQITNDKRQEEIAQTAEPTSEPPRIPAKKSVKWEKRCSERVTKKPDRWGNNVMISKIEKESTDGEEEVCPVSLKENPQVPRKEKKTFKNSFNKNIVC